MNLQNLNIKEDLPQIDAIMQYLLEQGINPNINDVLHYLSVDNIEYLVEKTKLFQGEHAADFNDHIVKTFTYKLREENTVIEYLEGMGEYCEKNTSVFSLGKGKNLKYYRTEWWEDNTKGLLESLVFVKPSSKTITVYKSCD